LRRRADALDALQPIVNTAFRRELDDDRTFVVDCLDCRRAKDAETRCSMRFHRCKTSAVGPDAGPAPCSATAAKALMRAELAVRHGIVLDVHVAERPVPAGASPGSVD
jgi:hypothetical protein